VSPIVTRKSPAKVNLVLKVLGKRADGFHEIAGLMQRISLCDEMSFSLGGDGISLRCSGADLPENADNIAFRAAVLFREATGVPRGVSIEIRKRIPLAAGLGGGSSNAATTLTTLNDMTGAGLNGEDLTGMGAALGSDVPFFIQGVSSCWAFGRGELLRPVENLPTLWFVICNPGVPLSTVEVYGAYRIGLTNERIQYTIPRLQTVRQITDGLENDLERVSERICPAISDIKQRLMAEGALGALMSGSGPTVFGIFESPIDAEHAASRMREKKGAPFTVSARSM
jgi:4-diphosphocytidyl-2-C-methyl-D-erythritol kinase